MTKYYKLFGAISLLVFAMGCDNEDPPLPKPNVNFETDPELIEVGKPVVFENLTTNASTYEWSFGDGQTSTQINPTITYVDAGTYTVKLVAITEDNQRDSVSREIDVLERVMTAISINSIPFLNPEGNDWDDPTGLPDSTKYPDFILFISPVDDFDRFLNTPPIVDLAPFELPIGFTLNPGDPYVLTDEDWELTFIDFDGDLESPDPPAETDFEIMEIITFNPVQIPTGSITEDGEGFVQIAIGQYSVDIFFQLE